VSDVLPALRYEPRLVREVLSALLRGAAWVRYHLACDDLYAKQVGPAREQAFAALEDETFRGLEMHAVFERALRDVGPLPGLREIRVLAAHGAAEEGADLALAGCVAVLRVLPARVRGEARALRAFLLHELTHLRDLLDPAFGHRREEPAPGEVRSRADLVRDRYRVLWNASVDGRLDRRGEALPGTQAARRAEVSRSFAGLDLAEADRLFVDAWNGRLAAHEALLAAARTRSSRGAGLRPGETCPLCRFPAWEIAPLAELGAVAAAVRREEPAWSVDDGLCGRCLEFFRIRSEVEAWRSPVETS
jgi:hypothetical protein